eukprot:Nitzschia sp. Nitz4//scaffold147_size54853//12428//13465//NITZ4_006610-RA/size54853-processed-gene-0.9-mRNA-1//1//CDS//3329536672//5926//frame0
MTCTSMTPPNLNKDGFNEESSGLGLSLADQLLLQQARAALSLAAPQASSNTLLLEAYIAEEKRRQALMASIPSLMSNHMLPQQGSALRNLISSTLPPPLPAVSSMELSRLLGLGGLGSSTPSSLGGSLNNLSSLLSSNTGVAHSRAAALAQPQGLMDPVSSSLWLGRAAAPPAVPQLSRAQSEELMLDALEREGKKGRTGTFPQKLHQMLADLEKEDDGNAIASYLPHGRAFVIHKPKEFVETIMPKYFRMSRFSSFQRQLNLYEFIRITDGPDKGAYYHELFMRGRPILASQIRRMKSKGTSPAVPLSTSKQDGMVKGSDSVASSIDDNEEVQAESSKTVKEQP